MPEIKFLQDCVSGNPNIMSQAFQESAALAPAQYLNLNLNLNHNHLR